MECKILQMSQFAAAKLQQATTGTVHSVYRNTINLKINDQLLALQTFGSPLSPISLLTERSESQLSTSTLTPGEVVHIADQTLLLHGDRFSFAASQILSLQLSSALSVSKRNELQKMLCNLLQMSDRGGFDTIFYQYAHPNSSLPSLILEGAAAILKEGYTLLQRKEEQEAAQILVKLIGLGTGLTPSGDDFLCGLLASQTLCGLEATPFCQTLRTEIQKRLHHTNDISRAFLDCALLKQFSLPVYALTQSPSERSIEESFGAIGHSSGFDTLCGILFGLFFSNIA